MSLRLATLDGFHIPRRTPRRIVPLTKAILAQIVDLQNDVILLNTGIRNEELQQRVVDYGLGIAAYEGQSLLGAGGIMPIWQGRAQGWLLRAPDLTPRQVVYIVKLARVYFDEWQKYPQYRRIEIQIRADQPWRVPFARFLGMNECFGPMRCWDEGGRDYYSYARIK